MLPSTLAATGRTAGRPSASHLAHDALSPEYSSRRLPNSSRLTAVQALAQTQRPEALTALAKLVTELGPNTELGRAALDAVQLLHASLRKAEESPRTVAFRGAVAAGRN